ncbi:effector-associated constant component EACC1 [Streptomyces luteireticuli]|uniref:Uncharacterized protein n=1 Tax=Streptomyces luteireticuli TaxID=173858 RepID=A0ABN0YUB2_9ACTN
MSTVHSDPNRYRISIVDDDPLRARREARELLAEIAGADPQATLDIPHQQAARATDKGGPVAELIGLIFSGGSLVAAGVQIWLARVPQRTIVVTRADGATLRISGKEARTDDQRIERFLADGSANDPGDEDGSSAE